MGLNKFLFENSVSNNRTFESINKMLGNPRHSDNPDVSLPIDITQNKSTWKASSNPEALNKIFTFERLNHTIYFFSEVYKYSNDINHEIKITVKGLSVAIQTTTHDYNGITSQDMKIKNFCDEIFADMQYFSVA